MAEVLTVHLAPDKVYVSASVDFEDRVAVGEIERLLAEVEARLRHDWPVIAALYVKPKAAAARAGVPTPGDIG